jgi:hypothetical protein
MATLVPKGAIKPLAADPKRGVMGYGSTSNPMEIVKIN